MQSYSLRVEGAQTVLAMGDVPTPTPGPGQVLLRMHAAGLNRGEFIPGGLVKAGASKPAGIEGSGEVAALGEGVTTLKVGDRVMGRCPGAFSEFAVMDVREAIRVPPGLAMETAAAVPLTFLVVHDMLVQQGHLQAGEWLLITGVSSGVGVAALPLLGGQVRELVLLAHRGSGTTILAVAERAAPGPEARGRIGLRREREQREEQQRQSGTAQKEHGP